MALSVAETRWLAAYKSALLEKYPRLLLRMALFGSKARGDDHSDSDLDILVIVKDDALRLKREMRRIGYLLAATGEAVPSILVYTESEWQARKQSRSPFRQAVERDEVRLQ